MRVPGGGREHPRRVGIVPHAPHAGARARTERNSALNRGAADAGQRGRFFDNGIGLDEVGIAGIETATLEQAPHPLAHGDARQHLVNQPGGGFAHAPAAAAGAEAPALAGKRHESLHRAVGAAQAREAMRQHATGQEVSELLFHELGQRGAVRMTPGRLEEGVSRSGRRAGAGSRDSRGARSPLSWWARVRALRPARGST
jgi:hypothetical protein